MAAPQTATLPLSESERQQRREDIARLGVCEAARRAGVSISAMSHWAKRNGVHTTPGEG